MIPILRSSDKKSLNRLLGQRRTSLEEALRVAGTILADIRRNGDRALARLSRRLDGIDLRRQGYEVRRAEIERAYRAVSKDFLRALPVAARSIRQVAKRQLPNSWQIRTWPGVMVGQTVRPLDRIACYIPGGRFPLPSTVLMSVIPAQIAGVREILVTSPRPAPSVLVATDWLGIKNVYRLGGAQAIAAFAYGTERVPRVDKIVGPGNRYVAAAKKLLAGEVSIDFVAGPTELMVVGGQGDPEWIAADLVAQAEHDPEAVALLVTPSRRLALEVQAVAARLLEELFPTDSEVGRQSLDRRGGILLTRDLEEAVEIANAFAPEHLTLLDGATRFVGMIRSAGSIFLGGMSPVAAGDYASGSNHVLPTAGAARLRGGLSAADFVKTISFQRLTSGGLRRLRPAIVALATAEGLKAHARSVETRFKVHDRATQSD
jgi:histidinol dehydrogenase